MDDQRDLRNRFPEMTPIDSAPSMFTINGCGFKIYGHRDEDPESRTYVATLCICLLFIPIIPIAAYRVADAAQGWYFIGRVPLSEFAKMWNKVLGAGVLLLVCNLCWQEYTGSQSYKDKQTARKASGLLHDGKTVQATNLYRQLFLSSRSQKEAAREALVRVYESCKSAGPSDESLKLLDALKPVERRTKGAVLPGMPDLVLEHARTCLAQDPKLGVSYVALARGLRSPPAGLDPLHRQLLERCITVNPQDLDAALALAGMFEKEEAFEECERVLLPVKGKLGSSEGARILGTIMLRKDKYDDAYPLLEPYVNARMNALKEAEKAYEREMPKASKRALDRLNASPGSKAYRDIVAIKDKAAQERKVDEYLWSQMKTDGALQKALERYREAAAFAPSAMDLGMLQLNRAQSAGDSVTRKKELEAAERTFVSISTVAGDSAEYQLSLGEVYYWLGKAKEGREQLDSYLDKQNRSPESLLVVARIVRRIGDKDTVRQLATEAFKNAKKSSERDQAIFLLSQTSLTVAEKVSWLEKGDKKNVAMQIDLYSARAALARSEGDDKKAQRFLAKAIDGYARMPEDATILNNASLLYASLYDITGKPEHFAKSAEMITRAVELNPTGAILLQNAVTSLLKDSLIHTIGDKIDIIATKQEADSELLSFLYRDATGRKALFEAVCNCDSFKKAATLQERLYILSPRDLSVYLKGMEFSNYKRSAGALELVARKLRDAKPEMAGYRTYIKALYAGKDDADQVKRVDGQLRKYRPLLKSISRQEAPLSYAIVATTVAGLETDKAKYMPAENHDAIVDLAREAHRSAPSSATAGGLREALAHRACARIAAGNRRFRDFRTRTKRTLVPFSALAYASVADARMAELIAADADVEQIVGLVREEYRNFPDDMAVADWAIVKASDPALAEKVRDSVLRNNYTLVTQTISAEHFSYLVSTRVDEYLSAHLQGKPAEARRIAGTAVSEGVSFPRL